MLTEVKNHLKFMFLCVKYNLNREMENRGAFVMQILGMMANNGIMIAQWVIIFSFSETIGGYTFLDILLLWGLASATCGVAHTLFLNTSLLPGYITGGKLDAYLVQPKHALVNVACGRMSVSAVGDLLYGLVLAVITRPSPAAFLMFVFFCVTGALIMAAFYTLSGSLAFWLKNSDDFSGAVNGMLVNFGTYPEGLFGGMARWLLYSLIPVAYMVYVPVRFLTTFEWKWLALTLGFTVLITALAFFVFKRGLKRYASGNMMSARL